MVTLGQALDEALAGLTVEEQPGTERTCEALLPDGECGNDVEWILSCREGGEPVLACDWHMSKWVENPLRRWGACKGCGWQGYLDQMVSEHWSVTSWSES